MMDYVHVFVGNDSSVTIELLEKYSNPFYTDAGERCNSTFFNEIGIENFEPGCIEKIVLEEPMEIELAFDGCSYFELWKNLLPKNTITHAILLYKPNMINRVDTSLVKYLGKFDFYNHKYNKTEVDYGCA